MDIVSKSKTSLLFLLSKFPVGSSANMIEGLLARALAIEVLCCCPPEISPGK